MERVQAIQVAFSKTRHVTSARQNHCNLAFEYRHNFFSPFSSIKLEKAAVDSLKYRRNINHKSNCKLFDNISVI